MKIVKKVSGGKKREGQEKSGKRVKSRLKKKREEALVSYEKGEKK